VRGEGGWVLGVFFLVAMHVCREDGLLLAALWLESGVTERCKWGMGGMRDEGDGMGYAVHLTLLGLLKCICR
jgi:hypothetical protein